MPADEPEVEIIGHRRPLPILPALAQWHHKTLVGAKPQTAKRPPNTRERQQPLEPPDHPAEDEGQVVLVCEDALIQRSCALREASK